MTKADTSPRIGTPEGAVRACVTLIASVIGQPEELTERYLDLYYQVRQQAEDAADRERILRAWDVGAPARVVPNDGPPRAQGAERANDGLPRASAPTENAKPERPEKPKNAPYGKIKAEIRDRFVALRAQGMTLAQTVNLSGNKVTENQILNILNGSKVGMDAYNALEDAMNKWEATVKAAGQADSTTE